MAKKEKLPKRQISARIDGELAEQAERAAYWIGKGLNFSMIVEAGLRAIVEKLQREHNKNRPFPPEEGAVLGG